MSTQRIAAITAAGLLGIQLLAAGCARMEPAPGGPPDPTPPRLLSVRPDSLAVFRKFDGDVEFTFDEVIAEGGPSQGTGSNELDRLVILSPSTRVPKVRWRRNRIAVVPAEGWQPNRVYRVELLPGVSDLRRNRSDTGAVATFTTGAPAPQTTLTGTVVDWTTRRPVPVALVVALLLPDSLPYRGVTDSSGAFSLGPLPKGQYLVSGVIDQDRDHRQDSREAFDTVRLAAGATAAGELWAFEHDSAPPRIASASVNDSLSATVTFAQMLDPRKELPLSAVRLRRLPDSVTVRVTSLLPPAVDDSLHQKAAPADTTRPDTLQPPRPTPARPQPSVPAVTPLTSRSALYDHLVLRVAEPWQAGGRYLLEISNVRNVTGRTANVQTAIVVPEQKIGADSLKQIEQRPPLPIPPKKP